MSRPPRGLIGDGTEYYHGTLEGWDLFTCGCPACREVHRKEQVREYSRKQAEQYKNPFPITRIPQVIGKGKPRASGSQFVAKRGK